MSNLEYYTKMTSGKGQEEVCLKTAKNRPSSIFLSKISLTQTIFFHNIKRNVFRLKGTDYGKQRTFGLYSKLFRFGG